MKTGRTVTLELLDENETRKLSRVSECVSAVERISFLITTCGLCFLLAGVISALILLTLNGAISTDWEFTGKSIFWLAATLGYFTSLFFLGIALGKTYHASRYGKLMAELTRLSEDPEVFSAFLKLQKIYQEVSSTHDGWIELALRLQGGYPSVNSEIRRFFSPTFHKLP